MAQVTYTVRAQKNCGEFVRVFARDHSIVIDEPVDKGGTDAGMNPVELLLGSVAACMTLTLSIYAEAMGVKADDIAITVEGDLDSAGMKEVLVCVPASTRSAWRFRPKPMWRLKLSSRWSTWLCCAARWKIPSKRAWHSRSLP